MGRIHDLGPTEIRILGALLEKEQTTPDHYPLTVNALIAACNQKSNRSPVTELTETEIVETLDSLRRDVLAWRTDGPRSEKWSQSISRRLELQPGEKALLTVLMLRGPQTVGELRTRTARMHDFEDLAEVETTLRGLTAEERDLVVELPRAPGQKESRWAHKLGEAPEVPAEPSPVYAAAPPPPRPAPVSEPRVEERLTALEERLERLEEGLDALRRELGVEDD